jgi:hypothetical protein
MAGGTPNLTLSFSPQRIRFGMSFVVLLMLTYPPPSMSRTQAGGQEKEIDLADPDKMRLLRNLLDAENKREENLRLLIANAPAIRHTLIDRCLANVQDVKELNRYCADLLRQISDLVLPGSAEDNALKPLKELAAEVEVLTDTTRRAGDSWYFETFESSNSGPINELRTEIGIPATGGAIIHLYPGEIPEPIREFFRLSKIDSSLQVTGITRWDKYIAISASSLSTQEITNVTNHELVHAYISSAASGAKFPKWFREGVAVYLSGGAQSFISVSGSEMERRQATTEYREYATVFHDLELLLGRHRLQQFIADAVKNKSVTEPLRNATGFTSHEELRRHAQLRLPLTN